MYELGDQKGRPFMATELLETLNDVIAECASGLRYTSEYHGDVDLEPLWGHPPFEELMAPKG